FQPSVIDLRLERELHEFELGFAVDGSSGGQESDRVEIVGQVHSLRKLADILGVTSDALNLHDPRLLREVDHPEPSGVPRRVVGCEGVVAPDLCEFFWVDAGTSTGRENPREFEKNGRGARPSALEL